MCCQLLAVHTFVTALWEVGLQARGVALGMVSLVCILIALWIAIGASIYKKYETPTLVCYPISSVSHSFLVADITRVSIGAGTVLNSGAHALVVNTSGYGSHYLLPQHYISQYISGQKVTCLSMKSAGTGFTSRAPVRGLDTHSGELHWECFCKSLPLEL